MNRVLIFATLAVVLIAPATGAAKSKRQVARSFDKVWPTAVRHLRIDEGHRIVDKDSETGYVVFSMKDDGKEYQGALELVRTKDRENRPVIELVLRIEDRPSYVEMAILDRLEQKLQQEHGDEVASAPPAKER